MKDLPCTLDRTGTPSDRDHPAGNRTHKPQSKRRLEPHDPKNRALWIACDIADTETPAHNTQSKNY